MVPKHTAADVAAWILEEYLSGGERLRQRHAAIRIRHQFGEQWTTRNRNHNWAIIPEVLEEFRRIRPPDVVWSRSRQLWRKRRDGEDPEAIMVR